MHMQFNYGKNQSFATHCVDPFRCDSKAHSEPVAGYQRILTAFSDGVAYTSSLSFHMGTDASEISLTNNQLIYIKPKLSSKQ